jgi:acetylornithine deacetylase/succinyl-diaminopimelate desuccinylase-like protein
VIAELERWVTAHRDEAVRERAEWIRQPSVSSDGTGFPAATGHGADLVRRCGLLAEVVETGGWPLIVGSSGSHPADAPHVLIYGHYDVQPPGLLAEWETPPFEPDIRDGRMYGRGTGDNKGQHLAQLLALRALLEIAGSLPCRVSVVLDGEEEIGSPNLAAAIRHRFAGDRPDLAVWSDGPVHESGRATVVLGVRGIQPGAGHPVLRGAAGQRGRTQPRPEREHGGRQVPARHHRRRRRAAGARRCAVSLRVGPVAGGESASLGGCIPRTGPG